MAKRRPGWLRSVRWVVFIVVAGAAVHVLLPLIGPVDQSLQLARTLPPLLVGAAVGSQVLSYVGSGYLLHSALRLVAVDMSVGRGAALTLAASSASLVAGGTMGFAATSHRWVRAEDASPRAAMLAGWLPPLLNGTAQLGTAALAIIYLLALGDISGTLLASLAALAAVLLSIAVVVGVGLAQPTRAARILDPAVRMWSTIRRRPYEPTWARPHVEVLEACKGALGSGGWRRPGAGSALNLGSDLGCLLLLFAAAGSIPEPAVLVAGWVLPQLARRITFIPGGIGIVEGGMALFYQSLSVPSEVTVVVILLYRALSFWVPSFVGAPLAVYFERRAEDRGAGSDVGAKPSRA